MKAPVFLRIYKDNKLDHVKQFVDQQIVIGQSDESQLKLQDDQVSQVHAVIEERDSGYYISDLGSQTGVKKNSILIVDDKLQSGDEIFIGPYKIEFFVGVPKPTQAPKLESHTSLDVKLAGAPTNSVNIIKDEFTANTKIAPTFIVPPVPPRINRQSTVQPDKPNEVREIIKSNIDVANVPKNNLTQSLLRSSGATVEVVVAWKERIVATHHFTEACEVTMGSDEKSTIKVPLVGVVDQQYRLLTINNGVFLSVSPEMTGDYHKDNQKLSLSDLKRNNRLIQVEAGFILNLQQGEMVRLGLHGDLLSIYVRFVPETNKPLVGPLFDLTASEQTAILMSFVVSAIFGLYMWVYNPQKLSDESKLEEPIRRATITFNVPKKKEIIQVAESEPQQKKIVKVDIANKERTTTKKDSGQAAALRPSPTNKKTSEVTSSIKQGGSINTGKEAASAKSETRDVTKIGLTSAFGGGGVQKELAKAYSGSGELLGDAAKATGFSGSKEGRAGESLGGRLKDVGAGGKGSATYGISGVGTQGKGTGTFGSGTGGIGKRGRVDLNIGESEAEFSGSIDREAIRRVIRENLKQFEHCYNLALRKNQDAYGKVEIKWHIEERGRATKAVVKSNSVGDKDMGQCIARVIGGLTFPEPPPDQIAEVVYPFVFAAQ